MSSNRARSPPRKLPVHEPPCKVVNLVATATPGRSEPFAQPPRHSGFVLRCCYDVALETGERVFVRALPYAPQVPSRRTRQLSVGDNLEVLGSLPSDSVALIYLDPPFNSGRTYDLVEASRDTAGDGRTEAFHDLWTWSGGASSALAELPATVPSRVAELVQGLVSALGRRDLSAYLVMMAPRLVEMRRVLDEEGTLYLHCDTSASHYLKLLLDAIFGITNFRNEIVWKRTHAHSSSRRFGPVHDTLLMYSKSARYRWSPMYTAYPKHYVEAYYVNEDARGKFQLITCTAPGDRVGTKAHYEWRGQLPPPGRHWAWKREQMEAFELEGRLAYSSNGIPRLKRYVDDAPGVQLQDIWTDINRLDAHSDERVGFETQKPLALLSRIIEASSNPGEVVLDPFLGSGTTAVAAEQAGRGWIGIDSSLLAASIALARSRQEVNLSRVTLSGFPNDRGQALRLRRQEPLAFGLWGTSMLATLADRKGRSASLVTGSGAIRSRRKLVQVKSWVPMASSARIDVGDLPRGRLSKAGFVLRSDRWGAGLSDRLQAAMDIPVTDVPLESLFSADCRRDGVAPEVAQLNGR